MSELPDAEHVARVCREITAAAPTVEEFAEHARHVGRVYGLSAEEITMPPTPRDVACSHPVGATTSRDGHVERWTCGLCGAHLVTDRSTGRTTTEITGK